MAEPTHHRRSPSRRVRVVRIAMLVAIGGLLLASGPYAWTRIGAAGHLYDADAADLPRVDVALVLGAEVEPDNTGPKAFLRGRLDTAGQLYRDGHAKVLLISGDAHGGSGNETSVMTRYLSEVWNVPQKRIVVDAYGLDTYDSCVRATQVYGVDRLLVVTQPYHLSRAVALCRNAGIDADGVRARCECSTPNVIRNAARDFLACTKAAWDTAWSREPAIQSPPSTAVAHALT